MAESADSLSLLRADVRAKEDEIRNAEQELKQNGLPLDQILALLADDKKLLVEKQKQLNLLEEKHLNLGPRQSSGEGLLCGCVCARPQSDEHRVRAATRLHGPGCCRAGRGAGCRQRVRAKHTRVCSTRHLRALAACTPAEVWGAGCSAYSSFSLPLTCTRASHHRPC